MMKVFLIIIFWLTNNKTMTISIPCPREDLTRREVEEAAYIMTKNKVLLSENGVPAAGYKHAFLRTIDETLLL